MTKKPAALVSAAIVGAMVLSLTTGCGSDGAADDLGANLSEALSDPARRNDPLALGEVADFEWDRVAFVCPYETRADADERLGLSWDDFPGQLDDEGRSMFVFAAGDRVAEWTYVSRAVADPCADETPPVVEREAARFTVEPAARDGSPVLRHRP